MASASLLATGDPEKERLIASTSDDTKSYGSTPGNRPFLANESARDSQFRFVTVKNSSLIPTDTSIVPSSLRAVRKLILTKYNFLFKLVAWKPLFPMTREPWLKAINVFHPISVLLCIMFGYAVELEGCFIYFKEKWEETCFPVPPLDNNSTTTASALVTSTGTSGDVPLPYRLCDKTFMLHFAIKKLLHSISYLYTLYSMRCAEPEQFDSLLERVFLFMKQLGIDLEAERRVVKSSRRLLYYGALWVLLCMIVDSMYLYTCFNQIYIPWICTTPHLIILCCAVMVSFTLLSTVYVTIVVTYAVQCGLLTLYIDCLIKRIRENTISLFDAMEKCDEFRKEVDKLNNNAGISVSIVLVNFATIIIIEVVKVLDATQIVFQILNGNYDGDKTFIVYCIYNILSIVLIAILAIVIMNKAMGLTRSCGLLRKMGMEVRVRTPHKFEFSQLEDPDQGFSIQHKRKDSFNALFEDRLAPMRIDTFLAYMASLSFSAKLFMLPVRGGHVCLFCIITGFSFFFYYQLQDISAALDTRDD